MSDPLTGARSEWTLLIYLTGVEDGVVGGEVNNSSSKRILHILIFVDNLLHRGARKTPGEYHTYSEARDSPSASVSLQRSTHEQYLISYMIEDMARTNLVEIICYMRGLSFEGARNTSYGLT